MSLLVSLAMAAAGLLVQPAAEPCAPPSISPTSIETWIINRVYVTGDGGNGVGLVVGWKESKAWVAVPAHVVFAQDWPSETARSAAQSRIEVRWGRDRLRMPACVGHVPPAPELDLTIVCVEWAGKPPFWSALEAGRLMPRMPLALLAPGLDAPIPGSAPTSGVTLALDTIPAEGLTGEEGMSGSPVAAPTGIVGIYQGRGASPTVLSLRAVKRVATAAGVPWSLIEHEFFDCGASRRVCPSIDGPAVPESITLSAGRVVRHTIRLGECAEVPEEKYLVLDPTERVTCQPVTVSVRASDGPLRLALRCEPNLQGRWEAPGGHTLFCRSLGEGAAQCSGLMTLGMGTFKGTLQAGGDGLDVHNGTFQDAAGMTRKASGRFTWENGVLTGQIHRAGYPTVTLALRRTR